MHNSVHVAKVDTKRQLKHVRLDQVGINRSNDAVHVSLFFEKKKKKNELQKTRDMVKLIDNTL